MENSEDTALDDMIRQKIENLLKKALDLTTKNPLISTKFSSRGGGPIRAVHELPDVLYKHICNKKMRFQSLPPLSHEPEDEKSSIEFLEAYIFEREVDEEFLRQTESLNQSDPEDLDKLYEAERKLKDKVREQLGMPPRPKDKDKGHESLKQHAKNNNIRPSWDLPLPEEVLGDTRYQDNIIQTLLLQEDMDRKLRSLITKNRSAQREKGIQILFVAFGFLEWTPHGRDNKIMSPLVLLPVDITKGREQAGRIPFWVSSREDNGKMNLFLEEKLRREENINLPKFTGDSIEEYLAEVEKILRSANFNFRIRRQVAFGAFPSSEMAIYTDLRLGIKTLCENPIIKTLLAGQDLIDESGFASPYPDDPKHEKIAPYLVMDADSSQFSALVDVMDGKNLPLEGPPGTGKSQTIVNIIANAIAAGKKVLFIAEKQAALEVVRTRLESVKLEEFILPLQAKKADRAQVVESIRKRLELRVNSPSFPSLKTREDDLTRSRDAREHLEKYRKIISTPFGATGMTVHKILGKNIKLNAENILESGPKGLQGRYIEGIGNWNEGKINDVLGRAEKIISADKQRRQALPHWEGTALRAVDPFTLKDTLHAAENAAETHEKIVEIDSELVRYEIDAWDEKVCQTIDTLLAEAEEVAGLSQESEAGLSLLLSLCQAKNVEAVKLFTSKVKELTKREKNIEETLSNIRDGIEASFRPKARHKVYLCRNLKLDSGKTAKALRAIAQVISESKKYSFLFPQYRLARLVGERFSDDGVFKKQFSIDTLCAWANEVESFYRDEESLNHDAEMQKILGDKFFKGRVTNFSQLKPFHSLAEKILSADDIKNVVLKILQNKTAPEVRKSLRVWQEARALNQEKLADLSENSGIDFSKRFAGQKPENIAQELRVAAQDSEGLKVHARYAKAFKEFSQLAPAGILETIQKEDCPIENLPKLLECIIYHSMVRSIYKEYGKILFDLEYSGESLNDKRREFADTDRKIIKEAPNYVRRKLLKNSNPPLGVSRGLASQKTEMGLLEHEAFTKSQGFTAPRGLIHRAPVSLQDLKPCWMMSPIAVAECLPQDMEFDLCVIDEASQMLPVYALGAVMRSKQIMICGDVNQLPPSNFFQTTFNEEDEDEDIEILEESILELANKNFHLKRRLRWHYRSICSALIAFCNRTIYKDDLEVFPSSREVKAVSLISTYGTYKKGLNVVEAQVMVKHILEFMRKTPDLSLGVVVMNVRQRDLLNEEWNLAQDLNPHAQEYIEKWAEKDSGLEEFFIKSLENVQGDERDCIFIGTVYGPEEAGGRVAQRFGPINSDAGWRRLNVLLSRAKQKMVTFTSMKPSDIIGTDGNRGRLMLKDWLIYSMNGTLPPAPPGPDEGESAGDFDSEFERSVAEAIPSSQYTAIPQVISSKYRIDIGVKDRSIPSQYLLAVECDGASYHSSRHARDRDRLRQEILEARGWVFHRIWSTDWFQEREKEIKKLLRAIEARRQEVLEEEQERQRKHEEQESEKPATETERQASLLEEEID